ncbi:MAG: TetR/AcrR family transcriptional regulator, partial [Clostridiales bacterium]|nr:TetR/AcrR family transcriptional regulator [Clostridiales bacterium]
MNNIKKVKKENRSVIKTKRKLKVGLLSLLKERPATEITVKELCELVDINRGTFYYHYTDIYDMIDKIEEEFFEEFNE